MIIFYQVNYVKKFTNLNFVNHVFEFSINLYDHQAIVRKIQKKYEMIKSLSKKRYIQLKIKTKNKMLKTLLNNENKINFISRVIIKQLKLSFFFINKKICDIANTKLKTFEIHFFIVTIIDKNNNQRFFEFFFFEN